MAQKIKAQILEGKVIWIKEKDLSLKLEGNILIGFQCSECYGTNEMKKNIPDDGTSEVYKCQFCDEKYLIEMETRNPVTIKVGDREDVDLYKQMIPTLQKVRGVNPQDEINLRK